MQWISRSAPIYVWKGDTWVRELNPGYRIYMVDLSNKRFVSDVDSVDFTKKTRVMK